MFSWAVFCVLLLGALALPFRSCVDEDSLAERIRNMSEEDFLGRDGVEVKAYGKLCHVPLLIERMKQASGDIDWRPMDPPMGEEPPRYPIQKAVKLILARDYLQRHPETMQMHGSFEMDNSLQLLDWWNENKEAALGDGSYRMPKCTPWTSSPPTEEEMAALRRAAAECEEQNAEFKAAGYKTINEMLVAEGRMNEVAPARPVVSARRAPSSFVARVLNEAIVLLNFPLLVGTAGVLVSAFVRTRRRICLVLALAVVLIGAPVGRGFVHVLLVCWRGESIGLSAAFISVFNKFATVGWMLAAAVAAYAALRTSPRGYHVSEPGDAPSSPNMEDR